MMKVVGYQFHFVGVDKSGADNYLKHTLVYSFISTKSNHRLQKLISIILLSDTS